MVNNSQEHLEPPFIQRLMHLSYRTITRPARRPFSLLDALTYSVIPRIAFEEVVVTVSKPITDLGAGDPGKVATGIGSCTLQGWVFARNRRDRC